MTDSDRADSSQPYTVVVLGPGDTARAAYEEIRAATSYRVVAAPTPAQAATHFEHRNALGLIVVVEPDNLDDVVADLDATGTFPNWPLLLLAPGAKRHDVQNAIDTNRLAGVFKAPWVPGALGDACRIELDLHAGAVGAGGEPRRRSNQVATFSRHLGDDETDIAHALIAAVEKVLGPRTRLFVTAGTHLTRQGASVDRVFIMVRGRVKLQRRTRVGTILMHHASTGPLIGLLSLAEGQDAYFDSVTSTDSEVVMLTIDQLDRVLHAEPEIVALLAALVTRTLSGRLRRSEDLQVELTDLNHELDAERARLANALQKLEEARLTLVAQARMATLGELAAGIGHELNNPVAALARAAAHLADDVATILASHPQAELLASALQRSQNLPPRSTSYVRTLRRNLLAHLGSDALARDLVNAGVETTDEADELLNSDADVPLVTAATSIGTSVRNLDLAANRIADLTESLRSYARPDADTMTSADIRTGMDAALNLAEHRLDGIRVERTYADPVPDIRCHPGRLQQAWTNLILNAIDALDGHGVIDVVVDQADSNHLRVQVADSGPGINPDNIERIFDARFTTKHGTVRYGMGLGLAMARQAVEEHGGTLTARSRPGRTEMTAILPLDGPAESPGDEES